MENEIVEVQEVSTPILDDTLVSLAEQAEKRINAMNKIKQVSLKLTNRHDWVDQNGKPFLQSSGAEKIARMFGISWRISEPEKELLEGGHFSFTYKGFFSLAGATIEVIGTRSSKDGFFKRYNYSNGEKTELPASEIDAGDVKKAAYTNCIGNGITRLLGIRNLTYDDLKQYAGINPDDLGKVDYKKSGKQQDSIKSEAAQTVTVGVSDVRTSTFKKKDGTQGEKYIIKNGSTTYDTFSKSFATIAKEAKEAGLQVEITYTENQYGKSIESIKKIDPPEREAGQEG